MTKEAEIAKVAFSNCAMTFSQFVIARQSRSNLGIIGMTRLPWVVKATTRAMTDEIPCQARNDKKGARNDRKGGME
ncbi:MAG: hypothetical protein ABIK33_05990 [candidate division WOR-3 bacterium]